MSRSMSSMFLAVAALAACTRATPEQRFVQDAAAALGGRDRVAAAKTLVIEGTGLNGNLGQDMVPDADTQRFALSEYRRAVDLAGGRVRIEQTRTPNFQYFQGQNPQRQRFGIDGDVGWNIAPTGTVSRASVAAARDRRTDIYHHPLAAVRAALDPRATVANVRPEGPLRVADVTTADGVALTLAIDDKTGVPARVASKTDNPNLGDVTIETTFGDYTDAAGLRLPTRLTTTTDGRLTTEIRVASQQVDADTGDLSAPAEARSAAPATGPPPATVTVEELAKGVWLLAGQSHHSVLVEFGDHLMLIEAPQNETRTLAVIAKARELRPDKPLTQVVATHHHFDHSGGIRAAVSEGLTVIAHGSTAAFYKDIVARPHTIAPDALAGNPKPMTFEAVEDERVFEDPTMNVVLHHIPGNPHADTLLMAYLPKQALLVEADVFSPGSDLQPYASNFLETIRKRDLRVEHIAPIHGTVVPFADLVRAVAPATSH